jgi:hypothetical protein
VNPWASAGLEPATFRLVAQFVNDCATFSSKIRAIFLFDFKYKFDKFRQILVELANGRFHDYGLKCFLTLHKDDQAGITMLRGAFLHFISPQNTNALAVQFAVRSPSRLMASLLRQPLFIACFS